MAFAREILLDIDAVVDGSMAKEEAGVAPLCCAAGALHAQKRGTTACTSAAWKCCIRTHAWTDAANKYTLQARHRRQRLASQDDACAS
eukprot:scaffold25325_cov21-Tisochrysis_lutea.AAC.2